MNAAETLLAAGCDDDLALQCGEQRITYRVLRRLVRQNAGAWQARGLRPGERVFVLAPDGIDWVVTYLGVIWAGGVAVGVNPRLSAAELEAIVADSEPRFAWCEGDVAGTVEGMSRVDVMVVRNDAAWAAEVAAASPAPVVKRDAEDPVLWVGTSGTTGTPKGVVHVHRTVVDTHAFACGVLGADSTDRFYATSKLFFAYALGNSLFAGLRAGATVILDPEWPTPERVEAMLERFRPSLVFCVPTLYQKMLQGGVARRLAHSGVRHYVSAGEALPAATRKAWREITGIAPISGYGTSETISLMLYCDDDSGLLKPTPRTEIAWDEIADTDTPQRIWIRHSAVARGYWRRPEAQADSFRAGGWFSPGDVFLRHPHDRLEYTGRNDDLLKIAGQWVSTLWVEQRLAPVLGDAVLQFAATGVSTDEGLTALALLAVAVPGHEAEAQRRMAAAVEALPRHRRPRWVHWMEALPLTATGKLQRSALKGLHAQALERSAVAA
ncbi:MAG TPA: AMP-binding protein [Ramlibacter sp.]|uniref:class I adenylate-forming enzyme family protein n=1 Tax=Ramlibacter sp. TaxID=1917967 RepID=UPI002D8063F9|nr:AMP-binding protein [Ramlibacter sp.]HET8744001.1 AMP-binding protein [Ramlibacter sp.]